MEKVIIWESNKHSFNGYYDQITFGNSNLWFLSVVMSKSQADGMLWYFNKFNPMSADGHGFSKNNTEYFRYNGRDNFVHIVFKRRVAPLTRSKENHTYVEGAVFCPSAEIMTANEIATDIRNRNYDNIPDFFYDQVYEIISKNTSLPVLPEWTKYIVSHMDVYDFNLATNYSYSKKGYGFSGVIALSTSDYVLEGIVRRGLYDKKISIDGCNESSITTKTVTGVDSYLNSFGQVLIDHTSEKFKPLFDPSKEKVAEDIEGFFDVCKYYYPGIKSFDKQKHVMEAGSRCLDREDILLVSGETGAGKTLLSIGTVIKHARKKNYSVIVLTPPKVAEEWRKTIKQAVPRAEVRLVESLKDMIECGKMAKNPLRVRPLWVIISESTAKISYEEHPAVVWSKSKRAYVCPHCGRVVSIYNNRSQTGAELPRYAPNDFDFMKKGDKNTLCKKALDNNGKVINGCGGKLWTAATKKNSSNWVKLDKVGWVNKSRIQTVKDMAETYTADLVDNAPAKLRAQYQNTIAAINGFDAAGSIERFPNRYSIARYIHKHLNHVFDYLICDEVHEMAGDSLQGNAFGAIVNSVWKGIFLTGTLSNGYASGLFYLLFRTQTKKMLDSGYDHKSIEAFNRDYGVIEKTTTKTGRIVTRYNGDHDFRLNRNGSKSKTKLKPGISPTMVVDFLMNNMISVSKKDIKSNLCAYSEVPVAVEMDDELRKSYQEMLKNVEVFRTGGYGRGGFRQVRAIKAAVLTANMFLDQPYGLDIKGNDEVSHDDLELSPNVIRPKERELIKICQEKAELGEKILVYCEFTNKLDIVNRLTRLLNDAGIKAISMDGSVKQTERQPWLIARAKEGVDAVVLNPSLIDVGLNLLDYTTIIFYEIGTQVTKIRQASQRSNRINQEHPVSVYFMYYKGTIQEDTLGAVSQKLKASKAVEGNFTDSALQNMTDDTDILSKLVNSIVKNEHISVDADNFETAVEVDNEELEQDNSNKKRDIISAANVSTSTFEDRVVFSFLQPENNYAPMIA